MLFTANHLNQRPWYHGSPLILTVLACGSTVTPNRALAEAFSHKPDLLEIGDDGTIRHNGQRAGYLYIVDEPFLQTDLITHPRTSMPGQEWLTQRDLALRLVTATTVDVTTLMSAAEQHELHRRAAGR